MSNFANNSNASFLYNNSNSNATTTTTSSSNNTYTTIPLVSLQTYITPEANGHPNSLALNRNNKEVNSNEIKSLTNEISSMSTNSKSDVVISYRNLGKTGLRVSQFGLGTWVTFGSQISDEVAEDILTLAYQSGINLFDTAEVYAAGKAEITLGKILKKKKWRRSSYIVTTKLYWGGRAETEKGLSRKHIIEGVKGSLERLQLDYVDIVFANKPDAHTPMEEIVRAFTHLINKDLAFYWGTSRWNSMEIMEAYSVARQFNLIPPICEQAEYHLFQRDEVEIHLPDIYSRIGLGTMTWSPLACGLLTGKYEDGIPAHSRASLKGYTWLKDKISCEEGIKKQEKVKELRILAEKLGCSLSQLSIAWCVKNESVNCILLGASSSEQLYENIQALQIVPKLTFVVLNEIEKILGNKPISRTPSISGVKCETSQK